MLGRRTRQTHDPSELPTDPNQLRPFALLTVIGKGAKLEGKFDIADSIQIECEVRGHLKVGGKVVIGHRGFVRADVQTVDAIIHGQYEGSMVATGSVKVTPTGRVHGNIETNSLVISKGGVFNGNEVKLEESEAEAGKPPVYLVKEKQPTQES